MDFQNKTLSSFNTLDPAALSHSHKHTENTSSKLFSYAIVKTVQKKSFFNLPLQ